MGVIITTAPRRVNAKPNAQLQRKGSDMLEAHNRILVVDDDSSITEFVGYALSKEGYTADIVDNGEEALELSENRSYDLFILDIMLPGMDGYELCRRLRGETSAPVLFLSARDTELDKVVGLEIGGDDYLAKPFGVRELIARVRALLRRGHGDVLAPSNTITVSGITLDEDAHVAKGGRGRDGADPARVRAARSPHEKRRQGGVARRAAP